MDEIVRTNAGVSRRVLLQRERFQEIVARHSQMNESGADSDDDDGEERRAMQCVYQ